jgi:hypothetical protein
MWKLKGPMQKILTWMQVQTKRGYFDSDFPVHKIPVPETNTASLHTGINYETCVQSRKRPLKV